MSDVELDVMGRATSVPMRGAHAGLTGRTSLLARMASYRESPGPGDGRFLSREACQMLAAHVTRFATGQGRTDVWVASDWIGELRWARNRAAMTSDRRNTVVTINRWLHGRTGVVTLNQTGEAALREAVRAAERLAGVSPFEAVVSAHPLDRAPTFTYPETQIWSDGTYNQMPETRGAIARDLSEAAEAAGMLSAGYLSVSARGTAQTSTTGVDLYAPQTFAQCSVTVRNPNGTGSGWAGSSSYDWARFDPKTLAAIALDKCLKSQNPVRLEPGRYTAILEPQAVSTFVRALLTIEVKGIFGNLTWLETRENAEQLKDDLFWSHSEQVRYEGSTIAIGMSKLGERIVDERITISHDPADPELGVLPFSGDAEPMRPVTWVEHGVLRALPTSRGYALKALREDLGVPYSGALRMTGGPTTVDEMVGTTKRGVLVTRFSDVNVVNGRSLLMAGYTRDGLWLVEDGKISKAVKNFRFTESPFFVLNGVEQLGPPVPVFSPELPTIVPPLKVRDFSFASLSDAI